MLALHRCIVDLTSDRIQPDRSVQSNTSHGRCNSLVSRVLTLNGLGIPLQEKWDGCRMGIPVGRSSEKLSFLESANHPRPKLYGMILLAFGFVWLILFGEKHKYRSQLGLAWPSSSFNTKHLLVEAPKAPC